MLFSVFFVRARIGPKKWGGQFDPPLVNRVLANTLVKEGLKVAILLGHRGEGFGWHNHPKGPTAGGPGRLPRENF